jgi:hypothetical protein
LSALWNVTLRISPRSVANEANDAEFCAAEVGDVGICATAPTAPTVPTLKRGDDEEDSSSPKSSKLGPEASAGARGGTRGAKRVGSGVDVHGLDGDGDGAWPESERRRSLSARPWSARFASSARSALLSAPIPMSRSSLRAFAPKSLLPES